VSETTYFIIPCGTEKATEPAAAADLYTSAHWRYVLDSVCVEAAVTPGHCVVLILSAKHGLLPLDQVIAPYDLRMGDEGCVTVDQLAEQCKALGLAYDEAAETYPEIYCFLGMDYFRPLDEALRRDDVYAFNVYEAAPGIGYQRRVIANINAFDERIASAAALVAA
jgi:hypothetical protein